MPPAQIVVFEKSPYWLPELQRRFDETDIRATSSASVDDVLKKTAADASLVVLVFDEIEIECLDLLGRLAVSAATPAVIGVASETNAELEWPVREAGAMAFFVEHPTSDKMVRLCRALFDNDDR